MKLKQYMNEYGDDLDKLQMQMDKINKQLPMMQKMIENHTKFKVIEVFQGGQESDPGLDLGEYSISIPKMGTAVLTHYDGHVFKTVKTGGINQIIDHLKKL